MTERTMLRAPARRPCKSCPYRRDVPSGVWSESEYAKLPRYDAATWDQDPTAFACHRQDGRLCAGWVAVHDMDNSLGLRLGLLAGLVDPRDHDAILDYSTDVPLFSSGAEAEAHGLRDLVDPSPVAREIIAKLDRRQRGVST